MAEQEWNGLPEDEKQVHMSKAKDENARRKELVSSVAALTSEGSSWHEIRPQRSGIRARRTLVRTAVSNSITNMANHDVFKGGLGIADFNSGLKQSLVSDLPDHKIHSISRNIFDFDAKCVDNPERSMKPFKCCALQYGGLCPVVNLFAKRGETACKNLYTLLMQHDLKAPHGQH